MSAVPSPLPGSPVSPESDHWSQEATRTLGFLLRWSLRSAAFAPVSLFLLLLLWLLRELIGPDSTIVLSTLGLSMPWHIGDPQFLTAGLTNATRVGAMVSTVWIIIFAFPAERILGSRRFIAAVVATYLLAVPVGILAAQVIEGTGLNKWGNDLLSDVLLTPDMWIFGATAYASGKMPVLWRRRTRLVLVTISATLVLYTGTLADIVTLIAVILGLSLSQLCRRPRARRPLTSLRWAGRWRLSLRETRILVATTVTVVSAGPVIAGLNPSAHGPFSMTTTLIWQPLVTEEQMHLACQVERTSAECQNALSLLQQHGVGPMIANLLPLILTLVISLGLSRGRRVAWVLALVLQSVTIAVLISQLSWLSGQEELDLLFSVNLATVIAPWLLVSLILLLCRRAFQVHIDSRKVVRMAQIMVVALGLTAGVWTAGTLLSPHSFRPSPTAALVWSELPLRYLPPTLATMFDLHLFPQNQFGWILFEWTGTVFWLIVMVLLYRLLMSVPDHQKQQDRTRASQLLQQGSGDHLSWMTVWDGNSYWWAPADSGYVAYRVHSGVAVTIGEPIVTPGEGNHSLADQFEEFALSQGWDVAWYSVREEFSASRVQAGHHQLLVAEEAVLPTANIEFKGKKFQNIRTARNRAAKEGVHTLWTTWAESTPDLREKIISLSEEWVSDKALPEMGFTLGTVVELADPDTKLLLAIDEEGHLHGVTSWLPVYVHGEIVGYTLDVMRRDPHGFRSVIEFLLAEAVVLAHDLGIAWVSLSGAPLSTPEDMEPSGILGAALEAVGRTMEPLYGFQSLADSKDKFHPEHHSWYLCYRDELTLPAIGVAVSSCYLPQLTPADAVAAVRLWSAATRRTGNPT